MHNGAKSGGAQTGKGDGLKSRCPKGLVGSTPTRRICRMRTLAEYAEACQLKAAGLNSCEISRATGIPRSTVRGWLANGPPKTMSGVGRSERRPGGTFPWLEHHAYAYLLGLYLGDGHIAAMRRGVYTLRIFLDAKYPVIIEEAAAAVALLNPSRRSGIYAVQGAEMKIVAGYSKSWPRLFPQHGPGVKHNRKIELVDWQRDTCDRFPERLLRGLIHSDGCRSINTIRHPKRTYRYPRYQFSNRSDDIRGIFCEYCDRIGVEWRVMNRWTISVARRDSVAKLDRMIGPKR